jgi:hypothetical protein
MPSSDPQSLVLRPSKEKLLLLLLLCLALTVAGADVVVTLGGFMGWFSLSFFGLGSLIFAIQFLPGASYLELRPGGFVVSSLFRKWPLIPWTAVGGFRVARVPPAQKAMVVFDKEGGRTGLGTKVNRALVGADQGPPDTYGLQPQELADLMNQWRANAAPPAPPTPPESR